jgi:glucokinase
MSAKRTLAIDVGGTKFSIAIFDGDRMVRRESHRTDAEGGRDWMLAQIASIARAWQIETPIDRCGIGFGGPVIFKEQRVALSTHVGGWRDFQLTDWVRDLLGVPAIMDNDANAGALGEGRFGAGRGCSPLFYMTLSTGIGGGICEDGRIWRGADSYGGEIGHLTIRPDGPPCLCGWHGCFERMCCGLWLERDYGKTAEESDAGPRFREPLRGGPRAGAESVHHVIESRAHRDRRRHRQSGRAPLRSVAHRITPADHELVRRSYRCGAGGAGRR